MASATVQPVSSAAAATAAASAAAAATAATTATTSETPNQNQVAANSHLSSSSTTNITQTLSPHPPPCTPTTTTITSSHSFNSKKRHLDHVDLLQNSPFFKIRAVLKHLRPLFLEVLGSPDIHNCDAARGIQEKVKLMMEQCRQKTGENVPLVKCNNRDLGGRAERSVEEKRFPHGNNLEKPMSEKNNRIPGTYIVGGSAFGWNFITLHGTKPEYYGRTKESFRAGK